MRLTLTFFVFFLCLKSFGQVKISDMTTTNSDPSGGWIPVVLGGTNVKIDAGKFYKKLDSIYRKSGTDSIFLIRNGIQQFAFRDSIGCCSDGPFIPQKTIAQLRSLSPDPTADFVYYIIDKDRQGMFRYEGSGTVSDDDGVMIIVTANNKKFKRIVDDHINVKWFGARGDGTNIPLNTIFTYAEAQKMFDRYTNDDLSNFDYNNQSIDWFALQAGINFCVNQNSAYTNGNYKRLYVPAGNYIITKPLIAANWNGSTKYEFSTFTIEGESSFWSGSGGTFIKSNFKKNFALGIHQGKGCKVKNIAFYGSYQHNGTISDRDFYASTLQSFKNLYDPSCEDDVYSPYSGIVIDPFLNNTITGTVSQYYEDLQSYYRGNGLRSGSTGIEIEDVQVNNFVVGVAFSPNGFTQNNEFSRVTKIQLNNMKVGISASQDQEKTNIITHIAAWSDVHTVFATGHYGIATAGQWLIEDVNLAGRVNQFISRSDGGYFPLFVKNFFSERLGKLGYLYSQVGGSFENAEIGFVYPTESFYAEWMIDGGGYVFKNCNIRIYGTGIPVSIRGNFKFQHCAFEAVPYFDQWNDYKLPVFSECRTWDGELGVTDVKTDYVGYFGRNVAYGKFTLKDYFFTEYGHGQKFNYEGLLPFREVGYINNATISPPDNTGTSTVFIPQSTYDKYYKFSRLVIIYVTGPGEGYKPLGAIPLVNPYNAATNLLTIQGVRPGLNLTNVTIACVLPIFTINPFLGDVVQGVSEIRNVRLDKAAGGYNLGADLPSQLVGKVITLNNSYAAYGSYKDYAVIYDYDAVNNAFKLADVNVYTTKSGIYFCNGCEIVRDQRANGAISDFEIMQRGTKVVTINNLTEKEMIVTRSGVFNSTGVAGETRQAEMVPAFNYNNHADARFYGASTIYFSSVADANSKILSSERRRGMSVFIMTGSAIEEYWYGDGINNQDLVRKFFNSGALALSADLASVTTTSNNNATGLSFNVVAGENYKFTFTVVFSTAATTTGIRLGLTTPAVTILSATTQVPNAIDGTGALFSGWITSSGDVVVSQGVQAANTNYVATIEGIIKPSASGTVQLVYGTEVAGSGVQIKQASGLKFERY